jgi:hypothetical protein
VKRLSALIYFGCAIFLVTLLVRAVSAQSAHRAQSANQAAAVQAATTVLDRHRHDLMAMPGVTAVGIGLMQDGQTVGIHIYQRKGSASVRPQPIEGVPVRVIKAGPFQANGRSAAPSEDPSGTDHTGVFSGPVPMGVSTGNVNGDFAGTLGYRVERIGNPADVGYITNNHVAAASGPQLCPAELNPSVLPDFSTQECQPGLLDAAGSCSAPPIGQLVQVIPLIMGGQFTQTVDTAFVTSNRGCVSSTILEVGVPNQPPADPQVGDTLDLSGRTSGHIQVAVQTVNATVLVGYGNCGVALFINQAITVPVSSGAASLPGDSGSPVVKVDGSNISPVGLNFAGNGFNGVINPAPAVFQALGVEIDTAPDEPPPSTCF